MKFDRFSEYGDTILAHWKHRSTHRGGKCSSNVHVFGSMAVTSAKPAICDMVNEAFRFEVFLRQNEIPMPQIADCLPFLLLNFEIKRINFIVRCIWLNTIVMFDSSPMERFWWWHQLMSRPTLLVNCKMANFVRMFLKAAISKHWYDQMANMRIWKINRHFKFNLFVTFHLDSIRFLDDIVTVIVRKNKTGREERMRAFTDYERDQPTFYLQFLMSYTRKRRIAQLEWKKYSVM